MSDLNQALENRPINLLYILKGTGLACIICVVLTIICGLLLYFTPLPESILFWSSTAIVILSVLGGSFWTAWKAGNKGLLHSLSVALLFFLLSLGLSLFFLSSVLSVASMLIKLLIIMGSGIAGGIIGVAVKV